MRSLSPKLLLAIAVGVAAFLAYREMQKVPPAAPTLTVSSPEVQARYAPDLQLAALLFLECVRGDDPRACLPAVATPEMQRKMDDTTLPKFREGMEARYGARGESRMVGKLTIDTAPDEQALFQFMLQASYEKEPMVFEDFAVARDPAGQFRVYDLKIAVPKE